jgi:hypothetical protein
MVRFFTLGKAKNAVCSLSKVARMAIFGNLAEFPLLEVMGMLEHRCGVLRFGHVGRFGSLELHVNMGTLQGLVVDGKVWRDGFDAKALVLELAGVRHGNFEFQRLSALSPEMRNDLAISVNEVLLRSATFDDEWNKYKDQLPDPKTRFTLAGEELVWLEGSLQAFWIRAEPLLEYGISVEDLAARFEMDLRVVQLHFYKLRTVGVVRPARRVQEVADIRAGNFPNTTPTSPMARATTPAPNAKPTLVSRLLGALRLIGRSA